MRASSFRSAVWLALACFAIACEVHGGGFGGAGRDPQAAGSPGPASTSTSTTTSGRIDEELSVRPIAKDTWVVVHEPFVAANVLVAKMPDGAVLVASSPFETVASRALVAWIKRTHAPARIVAINTHFHLDGTGGNEAYREAGVVTYASSHTQALFREKVAAMKEESARDFQGPERERMLAMKLVPADQTFDEKDGLSLVFGDEPVKVVYPGPGHSPDNVVVHLPRRGVVFGGCLVKSSKTIGYIGHADLDRWDETIEKVRALGASVVVPGHGPVGGPELYDVTIALVRAERAKRGGESPSHTK